MEYYAVAALEERKSYLLQPTLMRIEKCSLFVGMQEGRRKPFKPGFASGAAQKFCCTIISPLSTSLLQIMDEEAVVQAQAMQNRERDVRTL